MSYELQKLVEAHEAFLDTDIPDSDWNKLDGDPIPGGKIEIKWKGREFTDEGYFFALPTSDTDIYDICVHIPEPDNSDGMDSAPPVWINLYQLVMNKQVKWIKCK